MLRGFLWLPSTEIKSLTIFALFLQTRECDKSIKFSSPFFLITALLSGTLRTYQAAGCDHEYLQLSCPRGTTISIEFVQYGKYGNNEAGLCPDTTENTQSDGNVITSGTEIEIKTPEKCMWPQAQQVSETKKKFN